MSKDNNRKAQQVGRVDFRLLMAAKSSKFGDKRTKRNRTRSDNKRNAVRDHE
jgi:hypothetical protein